MKAAYILSTVVTALCAGRYFADVCDSTVVRFDMVWPPNSGSANVLMITCCATWIASLQVQRNSVDLTVLQREQRSIVIRNTGSGDCSIMTVGLLQENVNGDLFVKCNAEKGGFEQPCQHRLYRILPQALAPTTIESTPAPASTTIESTATVTDNIITKETKPGSTPMKTVDNATLSGQRSPDKSTVIIASAAAAVVIVLVATVASVLAVVMVKLRKCCATGAEAQFTTVHVHPDPKPMVQRVVINADDGGCTKESETSMIPKQPQDNTSASECYPRRRSSMPGHSMTRSDFKTILSAPDLTQLQPFNGEKLQEAQSNEPIQSSVECTDKNTSDYGGRVFVNL